MMQKVDLYSLLWAYANKAQSPVIRVSIFLDFIEKFSRQHVGEQPEWEIWTRNAFSKFWKEAPALVDAGKCTIQGLSNERFIILTQYYTAMIALAYKKENTPFLAPFADEKGLKMQVPQEQLTTLTLKEEFTDYLDNREASRPPIIKLEFNKLSPILILDTMFPQGLLKIAFLKVRFFLMLAHNYDRLLLKLEVLFNGQEKDPQELLDQLMQNSATLIDEFEESDDSVYLFWIQVCGFIKNELDNNPTKTSDDTTLLQTVAIIERCNLYFNGKAKESKAKEKAFEELNNLLKRPPYLFNLGEILKLVGRDGKPLLAYYSNKELDEFLKRKTTAPSTTVPDLIILSDAKKEQWFVSKTAFAVVCLQQLQDARASIASTIVDQWLKLIQRYETEPAMEHDREFKDSLIRYLKVKSPILASMFEYKRLSLLFNEMPKEQNGYTEFAKFFDKHTGRLISLNEILLVKRQTLLHEAHLRLPFWYSFPPFVKLLMLLHPKKNTEESSSLRPAGAKVKKEKALTFWIVCRQFEEALVPQGLTLDEYLIKLSDRWAKLINEEDRNNLREDVNSLIRDRIRRTVRGLKPIQVTESYLSQTTSELIQKSPALRQIQNNSLELYIKLYLIKLLKNIPR